MAKDLIQKFGESFIKKQCARCSSPNIVFFFEGTIAREITITSEDIIAKFKAREWFLNGKFYLCEKCVKDFAKLVEGFFEEVGSHE